MLRVYFILIFAALSTVLFGQKTVPAGTSNGATIPTVKQVFATANFSGHVFDALSHQPVLGAQVNFYQGTRFTNKYTLSDGSFNLTLSNDSSWNVKIFRAGYNQKDTIISSPGQFTGFDVEIMPEAASPRCLLAELDSTQSYAKLSFEKPESTGLQLFDDGTADAYLPVEAGKKYAVYFDSLPYKANQHLRRVYLYSGTMTDVCFDVFNPATPGGLPSDTLIGGHCINLIQGSSDRWLATYNYYYYDDIIIKKDFYIAIDQFMPGQTIGIDTSCSELRSYIYDPVNGWQLFTGGNFMIRAELAAIDTFHPTIGQGKNCTPDSLKNTEELPAYYELWRLMQGQENKPWLFVMLGTPTSQVFIDNSWPSLFDGPYRWAVRAKYYSTGLYSDYTYSNVIGKNWFAPVEININRACTIDSSLIWFTLINQTTDTVYAGETAGNQFIFPCVWQGDYLLKWSTINNNIDSSYLSVFNPTTITISPVAPGVPPDALFVDTTILKVAWDPGVEKSVDVVSINFENGWPTGTYFYPEVQNWKISDTMGQGTRCARFYYNPILTNYSTTAYLPIGYTYISSKRHRIKFDLMLDNYATTTENTFAIELYGNSGLTPVTSFSSIDGNDIPWSHYEILIESEDIASYQQILLHAFGGSTYDIDNWYIDNIVLEVIYPDPPCLAHFDVSVDGAYLLSTPDTSCTLPPGLLPYGTQHTVEVCSIYPSDTACTSLTFTSGFLPPVDNAWATAVSGTGYIGWGPPGLPSATVLNLIGFEVIRNDSLIAFEPPSSIGFTDAGIPDTALIYGVTACYNTSPGGDTLRSETVLCDTVQNSDASLIPFSEDWSSMSFDDNGWTFDPSQGNWSIVDTPGKSGFCAAFNSTPAVTDYSFSLVSRFLSASVFDCADISLSFDLKLLCNGQSDNLLDIELFNSGQWIPLYHFEAADSFEWTPFNFDITPWADKHVRIRFKASGDDSFPLGSWMIDNIRFEPVCKAPFNLSLNQSADQLTLNWNSPDCNSSKQSELLIRPWNGIPSSSAVEAMITVPQAAGSTVLSLMIYNQGQTEPLQTDLLLRDASGNSLTDPIRVNFPAEQGWVMIKPSTGFIWPTDGKFFITPASDLPGLFTLASDSASMVLIESSYRPDTENAGLLWSSGEKQSRGAIGYNVYRDGVLITPVPVADTSFVDAPGFELIHYYTVSAIHEGNCESAMSNEVMSDITIGENENQLEPMLCISPNPANDFVIIRWKASSATNKSLKLFSVSGIPVRSFDQIRASGSVRLNTGSMATGVYFIRLTSDNQPIITKKITIAH